MRTPVIGLDPSLAATGVATASEAVTIATKPTASDLRSRMRRISFISGQVCQMVESDDTLVVIEAPGFSRGAESGAHIRAGLWWALAMNLTYGMCDVIEVAPNVLKKFATGKGNATKGDMRMAWFQRTGDDVRDDNQVDALWLRQVGLHLVGDPEAIDLPKAQLAAIEGLRGQLPTSG